MFSSISGQSGLNSQEINISTTGNFVNLFVSDLNLKTKEEQLKQHFEQAGTVHSVFLPISKEQRRGFGFITMQSKDESNKTILSLNRSVLNNARICVQIIQNCSIPIEFDANNVNYIKQVIDSQQLSDDKKIEQFSNIQLLFQQKNIYELVVQFNYDAFAAIQNRLKSGSTNLEHQLLNTVEYFVGRISNMPNFWEIFHCNWYQQHFKEIQSSGFIEKIEKFISIKVTSEEKNREIPFSGFSEQIIRIYLHILMGQEIKKSVLILFAKIITRKISDLIKNTQKKKNDQLVQEINNEKQQIIENKLNSCIEQLMILSSTMKYNYSNQKYLIEQMNIFNGVSPLLHIVNYDQLDCPHNFLKDSSALQTLQIIIFDLFNQILQHNYQSNIFKSEDRSILYHLCPIITKFADSYSLHKHQIKDQQQQSTLSSPTYVNIALRLIPELIKFFYNQQEIVKVSAYITIPLIILSKYKLKQHTYQDYDINSQEIRKNSRICLQLIHLNKNSVVQTQKSQFGYLEMLISILSTAGGYAEENNSEIIITLKNITIFYSTVFLNAYQQNQHQTTQIKELLEQIEEEGGLEVIEAHLNSDVKKDINQNASKVKEIILNIAKYSASIYRRFQL